MKHKRHTLWLSIVVLLVLLAAGCGREAPAQPTEPPPTVAPTTAAAATAPPTAAPTAPPTAPPTAAPTAAPPNPTSTPAPTEVDWDDRTPFQTGLVEAAQGALDLLPGASIYHLDLRIADDMLTLQGQEQVRYTNCEGEPLNEVYFQLFPNAAGGATTVSAVRVEGQEVETALTDRDSALQVRLPRVLEPGQQVVIELDFTVEVAQEMTGNYGLFGYFDGALVLDEFYPVIPVYDDEGWNVQYPPPNADTSYFDTSYYLVRVDAPAELALVTSGIPIERQEEDGRQTVTFAAGPVRDFYLAASAQWEVVSRTVGETTVNSYTPPEWQPGAEEALRVASEAIQIYSQRFGPYPYTEFDVVSSPMQALGIEYPGMTGILLDLYDLEAEVYGLPAQAILESTVAHEVAHQWFYNVVGSDQIDEPWLDEAVVQYTTGLYYRDLYGAAAEQRYRGSWASRWDRVDQAEIPIGLPAADYTGTEYSAIVYGRGPYFLDALEKYMGRETFAAFMRDYYQSHLWGIATPESFRQLAEQHCDCNLGELFEDWVHGETSAAEDPASWIETYGGSQDDIVSDILLADDGGYFIVGATNLDFDAERQGDIYLIRTDAAGETLWEKTYGGEGYWSGQSISWADDGELLISGVTASSEGGSMDIFVTGLDQEGNELWSRTFGGQLDEYGSAWPMEDGGYLLGGNLVDPDDVIVDDPGVAGYGGFAGRSNIYLSRTDSDGSELWTRTFGGENNVLSLAAAPSPDGGLVILGTIMHYPEPNDDVYLLKVDEDGNEVWSRTWEEGRCTGRDLIPTADGNYLLTGIYAPMEDTDRSSGDFLFIKVDPDGKEIWRSTFGDPDKIDYASVLAEAADGGYIAAGNRVTSLSSRDEDLVLVKIDENGQLVWEQVIGTSSHNMFGAILRHPDGGYVIAASTYQQGNFDILLIKADAGGNVATEDE